MSTQALLALRHGGIRTIAWHARQWYGPGNWLGAFGPHIAHRRDKNARNKVGKLETRNKEKRSKSHNQKAECWEKVWQQLGEDVKILAKHSGSLENAKIHGKCKN